MSHPLADVLLAQARGEHLPADGGWQRVTPWRPGVEAIVVMTGRAVLAVGADVADADLVRLGVEGYGAAHAPHVVTALAGRDGWIDSLDVLLAARPPATATSELVVRPDLAERPRVAFARAVRDDVQVYGRADPSCGDLVTVSRGIAGLPELSFEVAPDGRGRRRSLPLLTAALDLLAGSGLVLAASAPGNVASLRALLSGGFTPLGSVQLYRPRRSTIAARVGRAQ